MRQIAYMTAKLTGVDSNTLLVVVGLCLMMASLVAMILWRSYRHGQLLRQQLKMMEVQAEDLRRVTMGMMERGAVDIDEAFDAAIVAQAVQTTSTESVEAPSALVEAWAADEVIIFAGASEMTRQGGPDRSALLLGALHLDGGGIRSGTQAGRAVQDPRGGLMRMIVRGDHEAATDLLVSRLGRERMLDFVASQYAQATPTPAFRRLCRDLPPAGMVSLAYDGSAMAAIDVDGTTVLTARASLDFERVLRDPERFVIRLGGDLQQPGTVSLTHSELRDTLTAAPDLKSVLLSIMASRTVLFVGMEVAEIESVWDAIGVYGRGAQRHYAITGGDPDFDLLSDRMAERYNVELINVGDAAGFAAFINVLVDDVKGRRRDVEASGQPSTANGTGALLSVMVQDIGPFRNATVDIAPSWTMLLGNNGAGKSTILKAIALVLAGTDREAREHARTLLRRGQRFGVIELVVGPRSKPSTYRVEISLEGDRVNLVAAISPLQTGSMTALGFTAIRGVAPDSSKEGHEPKGERLPRVSDVLPLLRGGVDSRVLDLRSWIRSTWSIQQDGSLPEAERSRAGEMLNTFFKVVDDLAPGFELRFSRVDHTTGEILLTTSDGELPISYVSQGMTSMIGWIGTLVQRLYEINGADSDPRQSSAIVLIDEIDSHLHPDWQQRLVPIIRQTFPRLQVVASTHSALMVGSLEEREVVKIERNGQALTVERIDRSFKGMRVDQILTDEAFDMASTRDPDWESMRAEYAQLLGTDDRSIEQEARYGELLDIIDSVPPPYESRSDRQTYAKARSQVDAMGQAAATAIIADLQP